MNKAEFIKQYYALGDDFDFDNHEKEVKQIMDESYDHDGAIIKLMVAQEECSELITAISKHMRGFPDTDMDILEEMADVTIMIEYILSMLGFTDDDLRKAAFVKIQREKNRLDKMRK